MIAALGAAFRFPTVNGKTVAPIYNSHAESMFSVLKNHEMPLREQRRQHKDVARASVALMNVLEFQKTSLDVTERQQDSLLAHLKMKDSGRDFVDLMYGVVSELGFAGQVLEKFRLEFWPFINKKKAFGKKDVFLDYTVTRVKSVQLVNADGGVSQAPSSTDADGFVGNPSLCTTGNSLSVVYCIVVRVYGRRRVRRVLFVHIG